MPKSDLVESKLSHTEVGNFQHVLYISPTKRINKFKGQSDKYISGKCLRISAYISV